MTRTSPALWTGRLAAAVGSALAAIAAATLAASPAAADPASARKVLKSMSDYMASQQSLSSRFDVSLDIITPGIQKIEFAASGNLQVGRPNKVRATRRGGYSEIELIFDGQTMTIVDKADNLYAQVATPGTLDSLVDVLRGQYGIDMPGADLLLTNSYGALMQDAIEANHIGQGVIGGYDCEHLAFRNLETDWQIWVRTGDKPLPCKLVITTKTVAAAPEYTIVFHDWKTGANAGGADFAFKPPTGAKSVPFADLKNIGDLPAPAPFKDGGEQ